MKNIAKYLLVLFVILIFGFAPEYGKVKSLIVAEYIDNNSGIGDYTYLVSYNFRDGKYISKDTILASPQEPDESTPWFHVRYDLGKNFIYQDKYVVSGVGNVIDVETKSFVMKASDEFIEALGDSLLFHRNNIWAGTGYLVLDLRTKTYGFVKDTNFRTAKGLQSPDHKHGIAVSEATLPRKILLYDEQNHIDTIVDRCGYGTLMSSLSSSHGHVPLVWVNNSTFIYADCSRANYYPKEPVTTMTLRQVNIVERTNEVIATIDSVKEAISNSKFWRSDEGDLIFQCKRGFYKVDYVYNSVEHYKIKPKIENGFGVVENGKEQLVKYNNETIGMFFCGGHVTTNGYFAAAYYDRENSGMNQPKGIKVWNDITRKWTSIPVPWISAVIGWIDK
jgi:hypothetical protein